MIYERLRWFLLAGFVLLLIILSNWIPWPALITLLVLGTIIFGGVIGQILQIVKAKTTPVVVYQPPEHLVTPVEQPTPYTQGYQAQPVQANSMANFPFTPTGAEPQPKQDRPGQVYEDPLVQYPE